MDVTSACNTLEVNCDGSTTTSLSWSFSDDKLYQGIWGSSVGNHEQGASYYVFLGKVRLNVYSVFIDSDYSDMTKQRPAL